MAETIDTKRVAKTLSQIGKLHNPFDDSSVRMEYLKVAYERRGTDMDRGVFINPENEESLTVGWSNEHRRTYKITDSGNRLVVENIINLAVPDSEKPVEDKTQYVQGWVDVVIDELCRDVANEAVSRSVNDEMIFVGHNRLRLRDHHGHDVTFDFSLA